MLYHGKYVGILCVMLSVFSSFSVEFMPSFTKDYILAMVMRVKAEKTTSF